GSQERGHASGLPRRDSRQLRSGLLDRRHRPLRGRALRGRAAAGEVPLQVPGRGRQGRAPPAGRSAESQDVVNTGQILTWVAFFAAMVAGPAFLAAALGRERAWRAGVAAFAVQWIAYVAAAGVLWRILFRHDFHYQYAASYSSLAMPARYIYAAFWGG